MHTTPLAITQKLCSTIEEFAVNVSGHNIRPLKIEPGAFNSYWLLAESPDFLLMIRQVEYQYYEAGEFKPDTYGFAFMPPNSSITYNGRKYKHGEKLATQGSELNAILSTNMRMITCFIEDKTLKRYFTLPEIEQFHNAINLINHKTKRAKTDDAIAQYLNELIFSLLRESFIVENDVIYQDLCEDIYLKIFNHVTDTDESSCSNIRPKYRLEILKKALNYIHDHEIQSVHITDIAQHVHTSQRNLQKLFQQYLGISPKAYLCRQRLNKIYQELLKADPKETNISDVSRRFGVIHQGNFSQDYFQFFGEYPKDTLKKNKPAKIQIL
jgi:AraC family transcriptional regulator, ethanolamine operon transcriptional activator